MSCSGMELIFEFTSKFTSIYCKIVQRYTEFMKNEIFGDYEKSPQMQYFQGFVIMIKNYKFLY